MTNKASSTPTNQQPEAGPPHVTKKLKQQSPSQNEVQTKDQKATVTPDGDKGQKTRASAEEQKEVSKNISKWKSCLRDSASKVSLAMKNKASSTPTAEKPAASLPVAKKSLQQTSAQNEVQTKDQIAAVTSDLDKPQKTRDSAKGKEIPTFKNKTKWESYLKDSRKSPQFQLMVINFTTTWCNPCKNAEEAFKKLAEDYAMVKFAKVDIDYLLDVAKNLEVKMMPTFILLKRKESGGNEKDDNVKIGNNNEGSKQGNSSNEGQREIEKKVSQKDKEIEKKSSQKGKESGKEGSQKDNESGTKGFPKYNENAKDKRDENEAKGEIQNFSVVDTVEGNKMSEVKDKIKKHTQVDKQVGPPR